MVEISLAVLKKYGFTLSSFLTALTGYYNIDLNSEINKLEYNGLAYRNLFGHSIILTNEQRDIIARILTESSTKLDNASVKDFEGLALQLMSLYPEGIKPGTTYPWRGTMEEVAQKLRVLIVTHDFDFTAEEAVNATKEYVHSFGGNRKKMKLLKNFLLQTKEGDTTSAFMEYIENNRM